MIVQVNGYSWWVCASHGDTTHQNYQYDFGKNTYTYYTYTVPPQLGVIWFDIWSFSADCREEFCWMNEWIEQKIPRVPAIPCLEVCQVWMVGKGNMQTYTQAVKVSATYHTDIYWQHLTAEICWNETICSRFWRSPCLGSQFWCKKHI